MSEIKHIRHYLTLVYSEDSFSLEEIINIPKRKLGPVLVEKIHILANKEGWSFYDIVMKNPQQDSSKEQVKNFNIFVSQIKKIKSLKNENIADIVEKIIEIVGYENFWPTLERSKRLDNIKSFVDFIQKTYLNDGKTIPEALKEIAILSKSSEDKKDPEVTLATVHRAKGLEFKYVFIFKMNQGVMPYFRASRSKEELEEERRIAYVALTRAKEELFLCSFDDDMKPFSRHINIKKDNVSPYIREIENSLIRVNVGRGKTILR